MSAILVVWEVVVFVDLVVVLVVGKVDVGVGAGVGMGAMIAEIVCDKILARSFGGSGVRRDRVEWNASLRHRSWG